MKHFKEGKPGFISDVDGILKNMEHSNQKSMQPDRMVYSVVLESLCTYLVDSDEPGTINWFFRSPEAPFFYWGSWVFGKVSSLPKCSKFC